MEFAALTTELANINAQRQPIIDAETVAAQGAQVAMLNHAMVGNFGYQVWNDAGTGSVRIVDDAGNDLPVEAMFSHDIIDEAPTVPAWARKGKVGQE